MSGHDTKCSQMSVVFPLYVLKQYEHVWSYVFIDGSLNTPLKVLGPKYPTWWG